MLTRNQVLQQQLGSEETKILDLLSQPGTIKRLRDNYTLLDLVALCHPQNLSHVLRSVYELDDIKTAKSNPYTLWQVDKTLQDKKRTPVSTLAASYLIRLCLPDPQSFYTPNGPNSLDVFDRVRKTISFIDRGTVSFHRGPPVQKEGEDFSLKPFLPWFSPASECYLDYYLRFRGESVLTVPRDMTVVFFAKYDQLPDVWLIRDYHAAKLIQLEDLDVIRAARVEIRPVQDQEGVLKACLVCVKGNTDVDMEVFLNKQKIRFTRLV
jgi:hypothetical protein